MNFERRYEDTYEPVDVEINGTTYCERIHKRYVIDAVKKYFHVELTDTDFSSISDAIPYRDGYHYFEWSGGWLSEGFSIVNKIVCVKANTYDVHFCIYDDWTGWYEYDGLYSMTPDDIHEAQIMAESGLSDRSVRKIGEGVARIYTDDLYSRSEFRIHSYSVIRYS